MLLGGEAYFGLKSTLKNVNCFVIRYYRSSGIIFMLIIVMRLSLFLFTLFCRLCCFDLILFM
jgi:hypothetical protein